MSESSVPLSDPRMPACAPLVPRPWRRLREWGGAWVRALGMARLSGARGRAIGADRFTCAARGVPPRLWRRHSAYLVYGREARDGASPIWAGGSGTGPDF